MNKLEGIVISIEKLYYHKEEEPCGVNIIVKDDDGKLSLFEISNITEKTAESILLNKKVRISTSNKEILIDDISIIEEQSVYESSGDLT